MAAPDYWWTGSEAIAGTQDPSEGWIPVYVEKPTFDPRTLYSWVQEGWSPVTDWINPDYTAQFYNVRAGGMRDLDLRSNYGITYGDPYDDVIPSSGGEDTGDDTGDDTYDPGAVTSELGGYEIIDGPGGPQIVDADGNVLLDASNLYNLLTDMQNLAPEFGPFGEWLRNYGLTDLGYSVSEDGQYILDEDGNQVMTVEEWDSGGALAKLFAPGDYTTPGITPIDENGDGVYEAIADAEGNIIFRFDTSLVPNTDWTVTEDAIVDADGNVLMDLTDLPPGFDITTTDPYQMMQQISEMLAQGYTEEDMAGAKAFAALAFGMTPEEYDAAIAAMQGRMAQGPGAYAGMGEDERFWRERAVRTAAFNAEERASRLANNIFASFGSASRAYMASEQLLMQIHQEELQGYIAVADEDYERRVAQWEAEERRWQTMVESGRMSMSEYLANLTNSRAQALTGYAEQVNALLTQHATEMEAALRMRETEINTFLAKYDTDLNAYLSQQKTVMDTILAGQGLLLEQEIAANDDQIEAAQNLLSIYQADMQTLQQKFEALYQAINAELGLDEAMMNFLAQQFEFDVAEWKHQWDNTMMELEYTDLTTTDAEDVFGIITPLIAAIGSFF